MRRPWIWLSVVVIIGALTRFFVLSQRGALWFDEAFSVHFASMDLGQMLHYLRFENNPPLYFILLHFWIKWLGSAEIIVRLLSVIFSLASVPLLYAIGAKLFNRTAALFATFLLAISSFQVIYATETRMYTMYLFLTLLSFLLFMKRTEFGTRGEPALGASAAERKRTPAAGESAWRELWLFLCLSLLIWTHITAWMLIAALSMYILWKSHFSIRELYSRHSKFLIIIGLLVLQFLPWALHFIKLKIIAPLSKGYLFYIPPDKNFFLTVSEQFLVFAEDNAFVVTMLSTILIVLVVLAVRTRHKNLPLVLFWLGTPLLIGFAFSNAIPRYFIAVSPAFYLLLGMGFSSAVDQMKSAFGKMQAHMLSAALLVILSLIIVSDYHATIKLGDDPWDEVAKWVEMREGEECAVKRVQCFVLVNPHSEILPFERYYDGKLPVVGFYPRKDSDDRDMRIVKTNWVSLSTKENIPQLREVTKGYDRVLLVSGGLEPQGRSFVPGWFWENGWEKIESREFGRLSIIVLEE